MERQTGAFADELRGVRGIKVERARTEAPADAKALDAALIGTVLVSLGGAGGAITALVGVLGSWVTRANGRKIRVRIGETELELTGAGQDEQRELVKVFADAVARDGG